MKNVLVFITVTLLMLEISYCENMDTMQKENMSKTKMDNWKFDPDNGNVVIYRRQAVKQMDTNNYHIVETEMKSGGGYRIRTFYADEENGEKLESPKMRQFLNRGRSLKDPEAKEMPMKKMTKDLKKTKKGKDLKDSGIVQIQTDLNKITQKPVTTVKVKITTETTTPVVSTVTTQSTTPTTTKIVETTKVPEKSTTEKLEIKTTEVPSTTTTTTTTTTIKPTDTTTVGTSTTAKAPISTTETTSEKPEPVTEKSTTTTKIVEETKVPVVVKSSTELPTTVKISEEKEYFPEMPGDLKIPVSVKYTEIKRTSSVPVASTTEEISSSSVDVTKVTQSSPRGSQKFEKSE